MAEGKHFWELCMLSYIDRAGLFGTQREWFEAAAKRQAIHQALFEQHITGRSRDDHQDRCFGMAGGERPVGRVGPVEEPQ